MSASPRFVQLLGRLEVSFWRWMGINGAPVLAVCDGPGSFNPRPRSRDKNQSVLDSIFDSHVWAVPKFRRSLERRLSRKMGGKKHFDSYGLPKNNIIACLECGHWHEKHTICGNCYSKVKEETRLMQEAMGEEANFYAPQKEVVFTYQGDERKNLEDKFVVNMEKKRPSWFSKSLLNKLPES